MPRIPLDQAEEENVNPIVLPELRTWCYVQQPALYEISCDRCGGDNITWSEFAHMIWCYDCGVDTKGNGGIFEGPISIHLCEMLGVSFDRVEIPSGRLLKEKIIDGRIEYEDET
jgi:hypothetical protein